MAEHKAVTMAKEQVPDYFIDDVFSKEKADETFDSLGDKTKIRVLMDVVKRKNKSALPFVSERLSVDDNAFVVASLLRTAGILGNSSTISLIQPFLTHVDDRVRANAVEGLACIGSDLLLPIITPLSWDRAERVRHAVFIAFANSDANELKMLVEKLLDSSDSRKIACAVEYASKSQGPWVEEILVSFLSKKSDTKSLALVVEVLKTRATKSSLPELIRLRNTSDNSLAALLRPAVIEISERLSVSQEDWSSMQNAVIDLESFAKASFTKVDDSSSGKSWLTRPAFYVVIVLLVVVGVVGFMLSSKGSSGELLAKAKLPVEKKAKPASPKKSTYRRRGVSRSSSSSSSSSSSFSSSRRSSSRSYKKDYESPFGNSPAEKRRRRITGKRKPRKW